MPREPLWLQMCQPNCPSRSNLLLAPRVRCNQHKLSASYILETILILMIWTQPTPEFLAQPKFTPLSLRESEMIPVTSTNHD